MNAILPDVSLSETATLPVALDWVGMQGIDLPIRLGQGELDGLLPASADVQVDLPAATAKGIHMSRLYQLLDRLGGEGFAWLAAGGVLYTVGILFFVFDDRFRHWHGIWHGFVMAGSALHFVAILRYVLPAP